MFIGARDVADRRVITTESCTYVSLGFGYQLRSFRSFVIQHPPTPPPPDYRSFHNDLVNGLSTRADFHTSPRRSSRSYTKYTTNYFTRRTAPMRLPGCARAKSSGYAGQNVVFEYSIEITLFTNVHVTFCFYLCASFSYVQTAKNRFRARGYFTVCKPIVTRPFVCEHRKHVDGR